MKTLTSSLAIAAATIVLGFGTVFAALPEDASLEQILAEAKSSGNPVLLEFTGSDWCPPCKMMYEQVFSTDTFKDYAKENLVFVKLDFPRSIEQSDEVKTRNRELQQKFGVRGYPTVILLDSEGQELAQNVGFMGGGPEAFINWVQESTP